MTRCLNPTVSDDIQRLFNERGLRCTRQRKAVYEALRSTTSHPTADDLFKMVGSRVSGMSLATVYNTLEALCDSGLAQKIPGAGAPGSGNSSARYDATVDDHVHLRNRKSGQVVDVPDDLSHALLDHLPQHLLDEIQARLNFRIEQIQIELIGQQS